MSTPTRTQLQQAQTHALRLLRDGSSLRQVEDATGFSRAQLEQLLRDFPTSNPRPAPVAAAVLDTLPIQALLGHPGNIRTELGDVDGLAETIREHGILQPLLVAKTPTGPYVILDGHRRLAAAKTAGLDRVPVRLHALVDDTDATILMLVTGLQKADLHPLDEAQAYQRLIDSGLRASDIAREIGKSPGSISQRLALLNLTPSEQDALRRGDVSLDRAYKTGRARSTRRLADGQKRPKPIYVPHFTVRHELALGARALCTTAGHDTLVKLGPACGACWEQAIRDDAVQAYLEQVGGAA